MSKQKTRSPEVKELIKNSLKFGNSILILAEKASANLRKMIDKKIGPN